MASARGQADLRRIHPDWFERAFDGWWRPRAEARDDVLARVTEEDTGLIKNVTTIDLRRLIWTNTLDIFLGDLFIHQTPAVGDERRSILQNVYPNQSPNQIRNPDTQVFLESTQTQTRTVQFPPPSVARTINTVGVTNSTGVAGVAPGGNYVHGIFAYQKLSTPTVQSTILAADLLYRISFSLT
jgi:hypothetical protein